MWKIAQETFLSRSSLGKRIRCPKCGTWGPVIYNKATKGTKTDLGQYRCHSCGKSFGAGECALLDGIFLSETRDDLRKRSRLYVQEICKALELSDQVKGEAWSLLKRFDKRWGKRSTAAGAVYVATHITTLERQRRTQQDVAKVANVTEVTLRNNYRKILESLSLEGVQIQKLGKRFYIREGKLQVKPGPSGSIRG